MREHCGGISWSVARQENEQRLGAEQLFAEIEDREQVLFDFEDLPTTAPTEAGGIEDDGIVLILATHFAVEELFHIVNDPANRRAF